MCFTMGLYASFNLQPLQVFVWFLQWHWNIALWPRCCSSPGHSSDILSCERCNSSFVTWQSIKRWDEIYWNLIGLIDPMLPKSQNELLGREKVNNTTPLMKAEHLKITRVQNIIRICHLPELPFLPSARRMITWAYLLVEGDIQPHKNHCRWICCSSTYVQRGSRDCHGWSQVLKIVSSIGWIFWTPSANRRKVHADFACAYRGNVGTIRSWWPRLCQFFWAMTSRSHLDDARWFSTCSRRSLHLPWLMGCLTSRR